jgi:hypothetical protein
MRTPKARSTALIAVVLTGSWFGKAQDTKSLEQQLESKYTLTSINAEGGVVTQGVTLTLNKAGLTAGPKATCVNEYRQGRFSLASASKATCGSVTRRFGSLPGIGMIPGIGGAASTAQGAAPMARPFVAGEKLYLTKIDVTDAVVFSLVSDTINNATYKAQLKFQMSKGSIPDFAQSERMISEVFTSAPTQTPQTAQAEPPSRPLRDIVPPPAPPSTVSLGLTIDQVVAIMGQPASVDDLGAKKVYNYPSEKVTFVDGKVADVQ